MRKSVAIAAALLLAACGQKADLEPLAGHDLPPTPYGAPAQPDSEDLLKLDPLAAPDRSVELRKRSEERQDDPFDLPPE
ncbi:lipoprotein [Tsuneonella sp. YG55]|uniref:Lipoprotein n=1 Tax=Tsuneonella litorea TaxID=2976475 RepID=A0A9X2W0Z2_9SPHN|nr:lipoprotein [Tsuneonella litorea]MCT2558598.1 lipoprotein [Tsuneonella litorea]